MFGSLKSWLYKSAPKEISAEELENIRLRDAARDARLAQEKLNVESLKAMKAKWRVTEEVYQKSSSVSLDQAWINFNVKWLKRFVLQESGTVATLPCPTLCPRPSHFKAKQAGLKGVP
jgi:hypothetical protein